MRSCIVCSKKAEKKEFIRTVIIDGNLVFDLHQKIDKRGYYVCYDMKCIKKLTSLKRRFKETFVFDMSKNLEILKKFLLNGILKMIRLENLKNGVFTGVKEIITNSDKVSFVFISSDISESSFKKIKNKQDEFNLNYLDVNKYDLGDTVNKSYVVALGLMDIKDFNFKRVLSQYNVLFSQE